WFSGDLLFSQTCGYPLTHVLKGSVQLVATPCYETAGCEGPTYCSFVIVAADSPAASISDLYGKRVAFNTPDSQSGMNALRAVVAPLSSNGQFFSGVVRTGSHSGSVSAVAAGDADVAAVDCVSFGLFQRHGHKAIDRVRVLCRTASAPGLPYITAAATTQETMLRLREGLRAAMADPAITEARQALLLKDVMLLPDAAYQPLIDMEQAAIRQGYPQLA